MNEIILKINKEMEKQGLSQTKLAKKAGVEQKKVNRLLSGVTKRLDMEVVSSLRGALGMVSESGENYESDRPSFRVVEEIIPATKKPTTQVAQGIMGLVGAMTPEQQVKVFKILLFLHQGKSF